MTLGEKAYSSLRHDIIRGEFRPLQPLRLALLRDRYGLGFSPLREALTRLTAERLVVSEALRGFRVAPLSIEELRDTMETRTFVESEALRRSIEKGGDTWETGIVSTLHAFTLQASRARADDAAGLEALEERHRAFHHALIAACGSRRLLDIFDNLYLGSARYRLPGFDSHSYLPSRDLVTEHTEIADATLARDTGKAVALLAAHYRQTAQFLEKAHSAELAVAV